MFFRLKQSVQYDVVVGVVKMKYIFCDLDGTLLLDFYRIEESDIKALLAAQEEGHIISIATGRLDYEIKAIKNNYGLKGGYRISQNGGVVYTDGDDRVQANFLKTEDIVKTINVLKTLPVLIFIQTDQSYYVPKKLDIIEEFERKQPYIKYIEKPDLFEQLDELSVVTVSIWAERDENRWIHKELVDRLPDTLVPYISSPFTIDITHRQNSKGNAIQQLCIKYGISSKDIYVIGDSFNDLSMFQITQNSYVMDTADDAVKQHASIVVKSVQDAIYHIMNESVTE